MRYQNGQGAEELRADAVIDASGTWVSPNPAGADGLPALGERENAAQIAYGMPDVLGADRARYGGKTVAVLGAGHSAVGTLIELTNLKARAPGTEVIWVLRGDNPAKAFGGGVNDKLVARGELGAHSASLSLQARCTSSRVAVTSITNAEGRLRIVLALGPPAPCHSSTSRCRDRLLPHLSILGEIRGGSIRDRGPCCAGALDRSERT